MAKFIYRMQNILDIKLKLEDAARQEYADARNALSVEEDKLESLKKRRELYYKEYQEAIAGSLDFLKIEECNNAIDVMNDMIADQLEVVRQKSKELEKARQKLAQVMQERKMHEKLKEKKFDEFLKELSAEETKEIDQVVSYQFNSKGDTED
ncbi:MAG: flagellar export protein FliJ [Clostridium sp.]|nr:flagellar export protein FliJ [Clostridium sp.]MCM1398008.1 flagellar export protein FliJ [Clostridium sp.]MCM1459356.1 flagellar export protein FliJ [Bacteroides sp.]